MISAVTKVELKVTGFLKCDHTKMGFGRGYLKRPNEWREKRSQ